ncbi:hypothetical protein MOA67_gp129 [Klebsiella phage KpLz-2_45]|uniref:hypothetical protein n=1 Tax=Klebsiella phage KpLz-2_45 TaxID=2698923 RepID=UPI001F132EDD|nr:hypothetical protein MOA67_gp129 [Klebsiella phage KpLz-2_45]UKS71995.1 hypothetical protein KpLz245_1290 [Klebsiella phage KpLz-2_45]
MARFKVMVSGCRHYRNYYQFAKHMDKLTSRFPPEEIVILEGGANGTDYLAFLYALRRGLRCLTFPADWDGKGKGAGFIRNAEMMAVATHCVTFWDGESKGTGDVVRRISEYRVSHRSITIPKEVKNEKPRRRHSGLRKADGRTLSRIRKRHANWQRSGSTE